MKQPVNIREYDYIISFINNTQPLFISLSSSGDAVSLLYDTELARFASC